MSFSNPELLWLMVALPAAVAVAIWLWTRRRRRVARALGSPELLARLGAGSLERFPSLRLGLLVLAAAMLGAAAAGPQWGLETVEETAAAADLVLALDVSRSMLARDVAPNRLERERVLGRRLLRELAGDRIGLVAFAGRAYVLSPMTVDHSALQLYLDALDPSIVSQGGSSLAAAIRQSVDLARGARDGGRGTVVVVSDGEALEEEQEVMDAAERAARLGITVHTVGVGTPEGAPIPQDAATGGIDYLRGPDGEVVITRLDDQLLRTVAERTDGQYVRLAGGGGADRLVSLLGGLERVEGETMRRVRQKPRHVWFILAALVLLVVDGVVENRDGGRRMATRPGAAGGEDSHA